MKTSILRQLLLAFLGFGILMGVIFPFFASIFVEFKEGLYVWFSLSCLAAGLVMGVANYFLLKSLLLAKLNNIAHVMNHISQHDLSIRSDIQSDDMIGVINDSFNSMADTLKDIVSEIKHSSKSTLQGVNEIHVSALETEQGISNQFDETETICHAINELSHTASQVHQEVFDATGHADAALQHAIDADNVVRETIKSINALAAAVEGATQSIHDLAQQTTNIGGVLDVIESISEQTNLLALNAAIEAARAGEQGRGFAVVADEVRMLAMRTKQSTSEIQQIIQSLQQVSRQTVESMSQGQQQANDSVARVGSAGNAIHGIKAAISTITDTNHKISTQSNEQVLMVNDITQRMGAIHGIATTSRSRAQQTARLSTKLNDLANHLESRVNQFQM